ncbi:trehalase-like domain-containing protein [Erwinia pyrifoliae]|uniref:trehalase-like domain-containing protein n=1 Tax=Erwinia pyrifoliae TaxID=79967 RepID=UPI0001960FF9|nr:trehalase-like domain-containing protein [Erwinia pyrifoliae]UWS30482.1 DUF5911 domain-containing protein [Erwinia pyrifoliae]UXK13491.1 DUF5911 domain-containing protein [Erwinia pyrifoliae]CAX56159.1 uncharacterized protein EpC_23800 [Erwinia pyrifoliae Ep1/96]CAY74954.1 Uncharacterized protein C4H3.03c [Erwinia pyrifoliae DSM 12163]
MKKAKRAIEDHGAIGDLRTCALVTNGRSIDYFCWPNLDSPPVFSALLDSDDAGVFSLCSDWPDARRMQRCLPDSNILQTRWLHQDGVVELTDYMPVCQQNGALPRIIRRVKVVHGSASIPLRCAPVHDYAGAATKRTWSATAWCGATMLQRPRPTGCRGKKVLSPPAPFGTSNAWRVPDALMKPVLSSKSCLAMATRPVFTPNSLPLTGARWEIPHRR